MSMTRRDYNDLALVMGRAYLEAENETEQMVVQDLLNDLVGTLSHAQSNFRAETFLEFVMDVHEGRRNAHTGRVVMPA